MKPTLDKYGIDFIAVGLHTKLAEDFLVKSEFKGQLVINEKKDVFASVKKSGYLSLLSPSVISQIRKARSMNLGGVMENLDGFQLGGIVVIDPLPKAQILYQWDQPQMGVYPPVDEVLKKATEGMTFGVADEKTLDEKEALETETKTIEEKESVEISTNKVVVPTSPAELVD